MLDVTKVADSRLKQSVCRHFNLEPHRVMCSPIQAKPGALAQIELAVTLTADDLAGILQSASSDSEKLPA